MNSVDKSIFAILNEIDSELSQYANILHEALLTKFINMRLQDTLRQYDIEIEKHTSFLSNQSAIRVLKAIAKKKKQKDKDIINSYMIDDEE